ncbi:MAG: InlB B-repeat-containing protein [Paludibacteraceae bacterium]|nr:InlB B-repeat-containing protein [Paludibacteraceae bacterium]
MTNFKLNLKGQFNNSQTAVNPDCQPTVNRRSRLLSVLCLLALLTLGVGQMWAGRRVYCYGKTTAPDIYIWDSGTSSDNSSSWDQQRDMTLVEGTTDLWYFDLTTTGSFKCIFRDKDKNKYHKNDIEVTQDNMAYNLPGSNSDASGNQIFLYTEDAVLYFKMSSWWTDDGSPTCQTLTFAKYNGNNTSRIPINRLQKYLDNNSDDLDNTTKGENNLEMFATIPAGAYRYSMTYYRGKSNSTQWNTGTITSFDIAKNKDDTAITSNSHTPSWTTYKPTSTGSVEADETDVLTNTAVTLTPSLTSNLLLNKYKSVVYSVSPGTSGTDWTIAGNTFTPKVAGTYTITATITYYAKGFPSLTSTVAPTVTITASNPAADYTVTYDVHSSGHGSLAATYTTGGASIGASPATVTSGSGLTFTASPNSYYKVEAWYTNAACNTGRHNAGETTYSVASLSSDLNVYVKFEPITYSITYHLNGGTNHVSNPSSYNYTTSTITLQAPTKTGYTFGGWYDNSSFTGSAVTTIPNHSNGNKEYWAKWTINSYNITYSPASAPMGATYTTTPSSANYNSTVDVVVTPTAANYLIQVTAVDAGSNTVTVTNPSANTYRFTMPASNVTVTVTATTLPVVYVLKTKHANSSLGDGATGLPATGQIWAWKFSGGKNFYTDPGDFPGPTASSKATAITDDIIGDEWYRFIPDNISQFDGSTEYHVILTSTNQILDTESTFIENGSSHSADTHTGTIWIVPHGTDANTAYLYTSYPDEVVTPYNVTYNAGDHGSINVFGTTISSGNSQTIATTKNRTLTATPASGYEFNRWITTGSVTVADATSATTTVSATGAGGTVTATYFETVNSGWYIEGNPAGNNWNYPTTHPLNRVLPGETNVYYRPVTLPANDQYFRFWCSTGGNHRYGANNNNQAVTKGTKYNLTYDGGNSLKYSAGGTVWFVVDASGTTKKCWLQDPQEFYSVNFGYGAGCDEFTAKDGENNDLISGNTYLAGTALTFTQTAKAGYTFEEWNTAVDGSGSTLGTGSSYSVASLSADVNVYAIYTENKTAITITTDGHGTITTPDPNESPYSLGVATTQAINATASDGYHWNTWTVSGTAALGTTATTASNTAKGNGTNGGTGTVTATFSPNTYRVQFHRNGGAGVTVFQNFTYDVAQNLTANSYTRTGYNFAGWALTTDGAVTYANGAEVSNLTTTNEGTFHLYAKWTPKQSALTFDYQISAEGYGASGSIAAVSATYGAAMPALTGNMPTAANGYAFIGFFSETGGNGTKYYNADKSSAHNWDVDTESGTTLYAYYKKAEITAITFDAATVETSGTVSFAVTVAPTPVGTTRLCFTVLHSNDNPLENQPTITYDDGTGKYSFTASETSGTYKVEATLRTGSSCDGGTELDTEVASFQVAGEHTVTVQYKCGSENIKASTSMEGVKPLEWSDEITPPAIFGYTFLRWVAIDGVSITTDNGTTTMDSTTTSAIKIKAIYDGKLIARYTQNNIIYFKNTLGWSNVYVNLLDGDYWNNDNGSGNENKANRNLQMSLVDGTTDIYYYDYGNKSTTRYVSFTAESYTNTQYFYQSSPNVAHVVFPTRYADALTTDKGTEGGFYAGTPMFVPLEGQTPQSKNSGRAYYYNSGYWTKYTSGTGYSLKIYNAAGDALLKDIPFTSSDELMPMEAVVNLDASTAYKFELMREGDVYYGNDNDMTYENHGQDVPWEMSWKDGGHKCGLTTNAAGEYTFHLTYSDYNNAYRLRMSYDYPVSSGDYRVLYKDGVHTNWHPSAIVPKVNNGKDTVSFFIRPGNASKAMKIQQATVDPSTGTVSWSSGTDVTSALTAARCPKDSVYNICLTMDGSGNISVENVEAYTGNFYIRTGAANNKWDNYKSTDHMMTYSEYSEQNSDYTHYWMAHIWADNNVNLSFVVANDYSPCISDTMIQATYRGGDADFVDASGVTNTELNIRYMWHRHDNSINRAYLSPAQASGSKFLVLRGNSTHNLRSESGALLTGESEASPGNNHGGGADCMQFIDDENWIYETTVKVAANSYVKLYAKLGSTYFYYRGTNDETFDASHAVQLITGAVTDTLKVRVIYDFKTDRLLAAYLPEGTISENLDINADVMFIREHQGDISQLTFSGTGSKISKIKTAYAVMRFNKWTLNNKSKEAPHSPLASPLSRYERDVFYVSFPFRVNLNEVFGFGTYGVHWIMEEYDGAGRAQKGFWKDSPSFWKFITNRQGKYLEPNVGYILALDLDELGEDASVWNNNVQNIELFFPSTTDLPDITSGTVTHELPAHTCTINRNTPQGDRRIADSHWNIMAVPTYVNTNNISFANTDWTTGPKDPAAGKLGPNFLYTWNPSDNTLTPTSASGFTYHAMHAYTVQYYGDVTWTTSVSPSAIVAREKQAPRAYEWCLEIQQDSLMIDRTYVRMTDEEEVTTGFEFGYDMSKGIEWSRANVYSFITTAESTEMAAGNTMPLETEQTTIVPLGVYIVTAGDYTFAMPEGTNGVGVTLVDTEANVRTSLSALDYTVSLEAGEYTGRFMLEISPIQNTPTDIEAVSVQPSEVRKVMIDGILYIVKDGKMYDARGTRVE